jgi:hypothetical protein
LPASLCRARELQPILQRTRKRSPTWTWPKNPAQAEVEDIFKN